MSYTFDDWLKDLESGEFEQGQGQLEDASDPAEYPRYCCLGLLEHRLGRLDDGRDCETGSMYFPPPKVARLLDLAVTPETVSELADEEGAFNPRTALPQPIEDEGGYLRASAANDEGYTFAEIAAGLRRARELGWY
jgi:hypothetical protein